MLLLPILLGAFFSLLGVLLLTPFSIHIDSNDHQYQVLWGRILRLNIIPLKGDLLFRLKVFFWRKEWSVLEIKPSKKSPKAEPKRKNRTSIKKLRWLLTSIWNSFKFKVFHLNLDTDDYIVNAYLFPIFYFLNRNKGDWSINFEGRFEFRFWAINKPLWVMINMIKYRNILR